LLEALSKPFSLAVAALSVVGFLVGLGTAGLMEAFSVVALFYLLAAPIFAIVVLWPPHRQDRSGVAFYVLMVADLLAWPLLLRGALHDDLTHVGFFPVFGILAVLGVVGLAAVLLTQSYRLTHQTCPECMNVIHTQARVCHFCGLRFRPPVPSPLAKK
jgi:hypothetical protein